MARRPLTCRSMPKLQVFFAQNLTGGSGLLSSLSPGLGGVVTPLWVVAGGTLAGQVVGTGTLSSPAPLAGHSALSWPVPASSCPACHDDAGHAGRARCQLQPFRQAPQVPARPPHPFPKSSYCSSPCPSAFISAPSSWVRRCSGEFAAMLHAQAAWWSWGSAPLHTLPLLPRQPLPLRVGRGAAGVVFQPHSAGLSCSLLTHLGVNTTATSVL